MADGALNIGKAIEGSEGSRAEKFEREPVKVRTARIVVWSALGFCVVALLVAYLFWRYQVQIVRARSLQVLSEQHLVAVDQVGRLRAEVEALGHEIGVEKKSLRALGDETKEWASYLAQSRPAHVEAWLARLKTLRATFRSNPQAAIPELGFLDNRKWILLAQHEWADGAAGLNQRLADVRTEAKGAFLSRHLSPAVERYREENPGVWPQSVDVFLPYLTDPIAKVALGRYKVGRDHLKPETFLIAENRPVDGEADKRMGLSERSGITSWGGTGVWTAEWMFGEQ